MGHTVFTSWHDQPCINIGKYCEGPSWFPQTNFLTIATITFLSGDAHGRLQPHPVHPHVVGGGEVSYSTPPQGRRINRCENAGHFHL